ncbi:MAG TPA: glycoside hydrolase family 3 N-terminal domain-containing protein [Chthoniobacterales bacterium]|nr:glycoside hydrolase family 3 N-terminal domain-containing protein [Chthoniobacterales bacterium]
MERSDLGQLLLVGVPGTDLDPETATAFRQIQPGGFVLFARNIRTPTQLRKLVDDLRDLSAVEPIIAIDQEGGRVSRLKVIGNEPPNAQQLRQKGDENLIRTHGELTGKLLRLFGFNLDLCPVLDISFDDGADNSLKGRCWGTSVPQVLQFAGAFHDGLLSTGILSCGKHFPGYAAAGLDPHHDLPTIKRSRTELEECELEIFRAFADRASSLMIGHAWYPALDPEKIPASLSRRVVADLLKEELGFAGLIMTDDLDMGAIVNEVGFGEAITRSITAGNHVAMICHRIALVREAYNILHRLPNKLVDPALSAVADIKRNLAPAAPFSEEAFRSLDARVWRLRVAVLGPELAKQRSPDDGKRSPVEVY